MSDSGAEIIISCLFIEEEGKEQEKKRKRIWVGRAYCCSCLVYIVVSSLVCIVVSCLVCIVLVLCVLLLFVLCVLLLVFLCVLL